MEWVARKGEGRHKACPYRGLSGGMEWVARKGGGQAPSIRHLSPISTPGRVGIRGGVAGAEPPHKGGPNRPDRTTAVVSGQWSETAIVLAQS